MHARYAGELQQFQNLVFVTDMLIISETHGISCIHTCWAELQLSYA